VTEPHHGPVVRRLSHFDQISNIRIRLSPQPDGRWSAMADSSKWLQNHFEVGPDAEDAGAKLIVWLEEQGEIVPEPPDDFWAGR
jgi:hypothetical protein